MTRSPGLGQRGHGRTPGRRGAGSAGPSFASIIRGIDPHRLAAGSESEGEMANRGERAVAKRLGKTPVTFPSNHGGFLGGEYGQTGDPDGFAAKLRDVLTESG